MSKSTTVRLDDALIATVVEQLKLGRSIRRTLPPDGRLNIDRQLPFLFVHRPTTAGGGADFARFVTGSASWLIAPSAKRSHAWTSRLVLGLAELLAPAFGAFLIIELWPSRKAFCPPAAFTSLARNSRSAGTPISPAVMR